MFSMSTFVSGTEHDVGGQRVKFYMGAPGAPNRFAYLLNEPERDLWHCRARGGWVDAAPGVVFDRVLQESLSEVKRTAPLSLHVSRRAAPQGVRELVESLLPPDLVDASPDGAEQHLLKVGESICIEATGAVVAVFGSEQAVEASGIESAAETHGLKVERYERPMSERPAERLPTERLRDLLAALPPTLPLRELGRIEWSALDHAYGPAGDVPGFLQEVADDRRNAGFGGLYMAVSHQGSRYSSTPFVVPFLGHLLETREDLRGELLKYFHQVAVPFDKAFPQMIYSHDVESNLVRLPLVRLWPILSKLIDDGSDETSTGAIKLVSGLPELAEESYQFLLSLTPRSGSTEAARLLALGVIGNHLGRNDDLGVPPSDADLRLPFVLARILLGDSEFRSEAMSYVDRECPYLDHNCVWLVTGALTQLSGWPTLEELRDVLSSAAQTSALQQANIISLLRGHLLPPHLPARFKDLGELQQFFFRSFSSMCSTQEVLLGNLRDAAGLPGGAVDGYIAGTFDPTL